MIELVPSRLTHIGPIASRMREIDELEAWAMGRTPKDALRLGLRVSHQCWTAIIDGRPEAMLGVASTSLITGKGVPWLLGTDRVYTQGRALLTLGPIVIAEMMKIFTTLDNVVAVRNVRAIRLLRRWGFQVSDQVQLYRGIEFVPFRMEGGTLFVEAEPLSIQGLEPER